MTEAPLAGLTILDLSRVLSGPYCTMLAADMGARVIKIEHPSAATTRARGARRSSGGESAYYLSINRNKESVALDFKTARRTRRLLDAADRERRRHGRELPAGHARRVGLGYASLSAQHPRLIYVSISGFGQNGPRRTEPGYDAVAQAEGGLMSITGTADGPAVRLGVAIADIAAGMFAFQGLLLALIARGRTGRGQWVDVSLLDSVAALLTYQASASLRRPAKSPARAGNRHLTIAPYDTFETADGVLVLAVGNDAQWQRFCRRGRRGDDLAGDERFATNAGRVDALRTCCSRCSRRCSPARRLDDWIAVLRGAGVPCGAVRSVADVLERSADPRARDGRDRRCIRRSARIRTLGMPVKLSDTPGAVRTRPAAARRAHARTCFARIWG